VTRLIALDDRTFVAGQIGPDDIRDIAAAGVTTIVNNRPDDEEPGQPGSEAIREAAEAAGLDYRDIAVSGAIATDQIEAMAVALEQAEGKLLAFCRSGTRSTYLWALARASRGADGETLIVQAAGAGYDLTPLRPHLGCAPSLRGA
jgi:uncharacterized protein (TIGR01244 family)